MKILTFILLSLYLFSYVHASQDDDDDDDDGGNKVHFDIGLSMNQDIHMEGSRFKDVCIIKKAPRDAAYHGIKFETKQGAGYASVFVLWGIPVGKDVSEYLDTTVYPNGYVPDCYHHPLTHAGPRSEYVATSRRNVKPIKLPSNVGFPLGNFSNIDYFVLEVTLETTAPDVIIHDNAGMRVTMTTNLRPYHAGVFVSGIETSYIHLPPYLSNVVLHNYVPNHAPYGPLFPTQYFDGIFAASQGHPIHIFMGLGHTNSLGKEVSAWIWRNGTVPAWSNVTAVMAGQNLTNPFGDAPKGPIGRPELIEIVNMEVPQRRWTTLDKYIYPGDAYSVDCRYSTIHLTQSAHGDFRGSGEMCNYVGYYTHPYIDPGKSTSFVAVDLFHHFLAEGHALNPFTQEHGH